MQFDSFPHRRAVTRGFRLGAPRNAVLTTDGTATLFLRSAGPTDPVNHLWRATWQGSDLVEEKIVDALDLLGDEDETLPDAERAKRERLREVSGGITGFTTDRATSSACFVLSGRLYYCNLLTKQTERIGDHTGLANPIIDPTGKRVAATQGADLLLFELEATDSPTFRTLAKSTSATESWGSADFIAAEEMRRYNGLWWSPDGDQLLVQRTDVEPVPTWFIGDPANPSKPPIEQRYPAAGGNNSRVRLFLFDLGGMKEEVTWDYEAFEYLARVNWSSHGPPLITVQNREQTKLEIREIDPATGKTSLLATETDPRWVELIPGLPQMTKAGLLHSMVDRDSDTRRLELRTPSATVMTPESLHVTAVTGTDETGISFSGHDGDPASQGLWRMTWDGTTSKLSPSGSWATGVAKSGAKIITVAKPDAAASKTFIYNTAGDHQTIRSFTELPEVAPQPIFLNEAGWNKIAVLLPTTLPAEQLPIIMSPYGGPHSGRSIMAGSSFITEQWFAEQGFCVIVADGPGSPSTPSNEQAIYRDLASGPLSGQVDALARVISEFGEQVDPERVGIRGWSFGGYLSALAVLERPDLFHAAVAGAPVTDWRLYDTHYTERYLGLPQQDRAAYEVSDLIHRAEGLQRPLLLIHGLADDNVVAAHTLRLSAALMAAGRGHNVLPLSGVTHMTPQEKISQNLLLRELEFFVETLGKDDAR